jgi:hypothetical protein
VSDRHLRRDELVDLADLTARDTACSVQLSAAAAHAASCGACRDAVAALRDVLTAARSADVPEPSPLYWEYAARGVREAIAGEPHPPGRPAFDFAQARKGLPLREEQGLPQREEHLHSRGWIRWPAIGAAGLGAVLAVGMFIRTPPPAAPPAHGDPGPATTASSGAGATVAGEAESWGLVRALSADLDVDAALQSGLIASDGLVDLGLLDLDETERQELGRLLTTALEAGPPS